MSHGRGESRYEGVKRTHPKPVNISAQILIDRERCVLCQRCTRFGTQISGDDFISLAERGGLSQITNYASRPYESYFSGNIVQICPVGALTSADYRFQSRPFDLVSTVTTCENCAAGCQLRTDHRHFQVKRRLAGELPEVNEEWNCDKGRFGFYYGRQTDRLTHLLVRRDGQLVPASWPEAIDVAVTGLKAAGAFGGRAHRWAAHHGERVRLLPLRSFGARHQLDRFPLAALRLGRGVVPRRSCGGTHAGRVGDLRRPGEGEEAAVLVGFEPEDESPIVFLRLRKGSG